MDAGETQPLLEMRGVSRSFGGVQALLGVDLTILPGSVHGLMGPNGAGKTTALNIISGILEPESGSVHLSGRRIDGLAVHQIARQGIRRTNQTVRLFPALSARDNVLVGLHSVRPDALWRRLCFLPSARTAERRARQEASDLLRRAGIGNRAAVRAGVLSYGEQRRVEIARALASHPSLLLLDEPTAGMNATESEQIAELIRAIAGGGTAVLLVEHNLELVMAVCDQVTVLNFGRVIASGAPEAVRAVPEVITAYLGTDE